MLPRSVLAVAVGSMLALSAAGCGRRGPLQPPGPDASVPPPAAAAVEAPAGRAGRPAPRDRRLRQGANAAPVGAAPTTLATQPAGVVADAPDDEDDGELATTVSPSPTPGARKRTRAYTVPNEPFILDPLL